MSGCFGNSSEDRARQAELNRHLADDGGESAIQNIVERKFAELATLYPRRSGAYTYHISHLQELFSNIAKEKDFLRLGEAIKQMDVKLAGELVLELVSNEIDKEAREEWEDESE